MSFNQSEHIGRPAPGIVKAKGIYRLSGRKTGSYSGSSEQEWFSKISFGSPVIRFSGNVKFKFNYFTTYRATFGGTTPTSNRMRLGSGSSAIGNLLDITKSHTDPDVCADCPPNTINGTFFGNLGSYSDGRFRIRLDVAGDTGRTNCERIIDFEFLFILGGVSIVSTNLDVTGKGYPLMKLEQIT